MKTPHSLTRSSYNKIEFFHSNGPAGKQKTTTSFRGNSGMPKGNGIISRDCRRDPSRSLYSHCSEPTHIDFSFLKH